MLLGINGTRVTYVLLGINGTRKAIEIVLGFALCISIALLVLLILNRMVTRAINHTYHKAIML